MRRADNNRYSRVTRIILGITMTLVLILVLLLIYGYCVSQGIISPLLQDNSNIVVESAPNQGVIPELSVESTNDIATSDESTPVTPVPTEEIKEMDVINIAVFGMDNRYKHTIVGGRSDVNMILTIDKTNKSIRITSFMRDLLVYLPSQSDYNRINAAIVYEEGPEGAVDVIENEFGIDIDYYIVTSFVGLAKIIDTIGGVELDLTWNNIWEMNGLIQEMNPLFGHSRNSNMLSKPGTIQVNGIQAVAYTRIRHVDGGYARDSKQKEVLYAAKEQLMDINLSQLNQLLEDVSEFVAMDMNFFQFVEVATSLYEYRNGDYTTLRVPIEGHYSDTRYQGMAVIKYDEEYTQDAVYNYIYFNEMP